MSENLKLFHINSKFSTFGEEFKKLKLSQTKMLPYDNNNKMWLLYNAWLAVQNNELAFTGIFDDVAESDTFLRSIFDDTLMNDLKTRINKFSKKKYPVNSVIHIMVVGTDRMLRLMFAAGQIGTSGQIGGEVLVDVSIKPGTLIYANYVKINQLEFIDGTEKSMIELTNKLGTYDLEDVTFFIVPEVHSYFLYQCPDRSDIAFSKIPFYNITNKTLTFTVINKGDTPTIGYKSNLFYLIYIDTSEGLEKFNINELIENNDNVTNSSWIKHKNLNKNEEYEISIVFKNNIDITKKYVVILDPDDDDKNEYDELRDNEGKLLTDSNNYGQVVIGSNNN